MQTFRLFYLVFFISFSLLIISAFAQADQKNGKLSFEIRDADSGKLIPGKLVFMQNDTAPDLKVQSEGLIASRHNTVYTGNGQGAILIPAGQYDIWVGQGLEYSLDFQQITITADKELHLVETIHREVDTRGYLSGDMHLHTLTYSGHGDSNVEERIISCVAEGLEWAVATDHNHHTDYHPVSKTLGLQQNMLTTIGNEVSTPIGHFNVYPIPADTPLLTHDSHDAHHLFRDFRAVDDAIVIQVNHPRWPGAAYFTEKNLDQYFAETADSTWSWDFDAFEILNENNGLGWTPAKNNPISVKQDWFNMLNAGRRFVGVGNSDSHDVEAIIAGLPRNYIAASSDIPQEMSEAELTRNLLAGNVSVSGGIYVEFTTGDGQPIGSQVVPRKGKVEFNIRVQAANWVDCDSVLLIGNGAVVAAYALETTDNPLRFEKTISVTPQIDSWYLVIASGEKFHAPVSGNSAGPNMPLGFTNPIWVDANRDGKFTSLREYAADLLEDNANQPEKILEKLVQAPHMQTALLAELGNQKSELHGLILSGLLKKKPSLGLRLLIYRELARLDGEDTQEILKAAARNSNIPLEKLHIASELAATEQAGGDQLNQLNYLLKTYENYLENGKMLNWQMAISKTPENFSTISKKNWQEIPPSPTGENKSPGNDDNFSYWRHELHSHYSGEIPFLLESAQALKVSVNGKEMLLPADEEDFTIIFLPVKKGKNDFLIELPANSTFLMEPIDKSRWFDAAIAKKKIHQHLAYLKTVELAYPNSPRYSGGEKVLTDGLRASTSYGDRFWQGFEAVDFDATIDLENPMAINNIHIGFLHDDNSWIFLPKSVRFSISEDGHTFQDVGNITSETFSEPQAAFIKDYHIQLSAQKARYIHIHAENITVCPEWHKGAGGKAWLFVDEIIVR